MIFLDTNVVSETFRSRPAEAVLSWIRRFDVELAMSTVALGEILHGIRKVRPDPRAARLEANLENWRSRLAGNIFAYDEDAANVYGDLMADGSRTGRPMSVPDAMIAAVAAVNRGQLATRNTRHFEGRGLPIVNPWEF